ncbi:MAG: hypothetical protein AAGU19_01045 [Prolixibacteraceae bacterium]
MNRQNQNNKNDFIGLYLGTVEHDSRDKETSRELLLSKGVNPDELIAEGLRKIKRMQLLANAEKTKKEMEGSESVKLAATKWVDQLLSSIDFSLMEVVKKEELTVSFRNVENLSKEDIRNILIRHFTLKLMNQRNKGG